MVDGVKVWWIIGVEYKKELFLDCASGFLVLGIFDAHYSKKSLPFCIDEKETSLLFGLLAIG